MPRKIITGLGVLLGVVAAGFVLWAVVDRNWITPGERGAARMALGKLDSLQDAGFLNDKEFVVWAKLAGKRVDVARRAARTTRDRNIAAELMSFETTIETNHATILRQVRSQQQNSGREPHEWSETFGLGLSGIIFDSRQLHKTLD